MIRQPPSGTPGSVILAQSAAAAAAARHTVLLGFRDFVRWALGLIWWASPNILLRTKSPRLQRKVRTTIGGGLEVPQHSSGNLRPHCESRFFRHSAKSTSHAVQRLGWGLGDTLGDTFLLRDNASRFGAHNAGPHADNLPSAIMPAVEWAAIITVSSGSQSWETEDRDE